MRPLRDYGVENNEHDRAPGQIRPMSQLEPDFNIAHVMVPPPDEQDTAYILMGGRNPEKPHEADDVALINTINP